MVCNPVCKGLDPPLGAEDGCLLWVANFDTPITGATTLLIFLKSHLTSIYSLKISSIFDIIEVDLNLIFVQTQMRTYMIL